MSALDAAAVLRRSSLRVRRLGIDTHRERVVYLRFDSRVCRSEGFEAQTRVLVRGSHGMVVATLNMLHGDLFGPTEIGLSEAAFALLGAEVGEWVELAHPRPLDSMSDVRRKVYGGRRDAPALERIVRDIAEGRYTDVEIAALVTACAGTQLDQAEILGLTRAMIDVGETLRWEVRPVLDKRCVGGLPGNRTTPIVVAIIAACGLTIPKTSSRAITSAAGTADVMEMLAPVDLDLPALRRVVEREGGVDLDSDGQMVASVLSKKAAAGATHVVIDMPVGPTAKVRDQAAATRLREHLVAVGRDVGLQVRVIQTDGSQPVGRGIGPALEARDVLAVLRQAGDAPADLRERALVLVGVLLEGAGRAEAGEGAALARTVLESGRAYEKFLAICEAQGEVRKPPVAPHVHTVEATRSGVVTTLDNRRLARLAKLAGAPAAPAAGLELHVRNLSRVERGQPLLTVHAESPGELAYALDYLRTSDAAIHIEEPA